MTLSEWFRYQLQASADGFVWAIEQLPKERWMLPPPRHPDDWPAVHHAFHVLYYDQYFSLASIRQWLGGPCPSLAEIREDEAWAETSPVDVRGILDQFRVVRAEQIALLAQFDDRLWHEPRETEFWGRVNLRWVVTKTYQHTAEHIHDVLRMALFWDQAAKLLQTRHEG
jgi:hypothetical protein